MITIYIENKPYQVKKDQNLLQACLSLGFDLPYFCWHPVLHSVGACRQCAVKQFKDEQDAKGKIIMACMMPVSDNMRISINDPEAQAFRASVIEWLMLNHPHDCPVCDEGGECHLQDMTVMTGHTYRRTRFPKRTHTNQDLGPFINHEMNRCIACYRCVRFYKDYAGGRDLDVFASHDYVYFGRHKDGPLESEFSGNLIEVCPTGVFTDKTLQRHYTRKWDLQTAPSICVHCGIGCNTIPGERYGSLRRIVNRYNGEVNGYFLCDRGRFGYEFVNNDKRIREPLLNTTIQPAVNSETPSEIKGTAYPEPSKSFCVSKETALHHIQNIFADCAHVIGIGSPRASQESNVMLRSFVGTDNFYSGMEHQQQELISQIIEILQKNPAWSPSLHDAQMTDAVLILGEDITNTAPMLDLAVRQAIRNKPLEQTRAMHLPDWYDNAVRTVIQGQKGPLYIMTPIATKLDSQATLTYHASPDDIARLGFAIAHELCPESPSVPGISEDIERDKLVSLVPEISACLKNAKHPLIISGTSLGSKRIIQAAANIAWSLSQNGSPAALCYTVPECNSMGAGLINGKPLDEAFQSIRDNGISAVILLENDIFLRAEKQMVQDFLIRATHVIAIDHTLNATTDLAELVLPAGTFAEADGTLVNNEGRAQRFYQVFAPEHAIQESWRWIHDIQEICRKKKQGDLRPIGSSKSISLFDSIGFLMTESIPLFKPVLDLAPPADFRIHGMRIPRQPHRSSGRTAINTDKNVHEQKPPDDQDAPFSFSMEGYAGIPPAPLMPRYWWPGWNSPQAVNKFQQEVAGPLLGGDPGKRLIEPPSEPLNKFFKSIPNGFMPKKDTWLLFPLYHIYGSEELSVLSPGIAELISDPYLAMNPEDASYLNTKTGDTIEITLKERKFAVRVIIEASIPKGTAGLYAGMSNDIRIHMPSYGSLKKQ
ncbi:MAG: NADH-quinone oxidoreductase subunit NuoG [Nitrospirota bacterium]